MINVVIYDDHNPRREAVKMLIALEAELQCIGDFPDCNNVINDLGVLLPDIVLMDIDMPGINGIDGVKLLRGEYPGVRIIMQTVFEDDDKIFNSILAGADGYILKNAPPEKLIAGIFEVADGGSAMSGSIARRVLQMFKNQSPAARTENEFNLSVREVEVLNALVKGLSQKMIAAELFISIFTVSNHIKKIYQKLHVHSVSEAVSLSLRRRIV
jgi:DNA-binding NarL/FixJ family response regulator